MLTQASRLVLVFTMLLAFAQIGAQELPKGIMMPEKRQIVGTGGGGGGASQPPPSSKPTTAGDKQTSNNSPTPPASSNNGGGGGSGPPPSSSPDNNTPPPQPSSTEVVRSTKIPTIVKVTTTNGDGKKVTTSVKTDKVAKTTDKVKNSFVTAKGKTINAATLTHQTVVSEALVGSKTIEKTFTSYYTSDGRRYSTVITTAVVVPTTTGFAKTTIAPSLANGGGSGSSLSSGTKAVIGGVVGGIGGAAMIGGIAFVLWRLWGKKKEEDRQSDVFSDKYSSNRESNMTFGSEGYGSTYGGGGGRVNPASNF